MAGVPKLLFIPAKQLDVKGKVDGVAYEKVKDEGKPVIFIHGWLGEGDWKNVTEHLEIENPVVFYHQRCHGDSNCERFDFGDLAGDLKTIMEELGLEKPVLAGHSMGGMVALEYAVRHDNLAGLFLVSTSASTPEPEIGSPRFFLEKFGEMDREEWADMIVENYASETGFPEIKKGAKQNLATAAREPIVYGLQAMMDYDVRKELGGFSKPAILVTGEKDGAITMEKSRELSSLLGCGLHTLNCTHLIPQERPEELAELLSSFLGRF